jgi:macrolide-specific efflux system membrane fusion protein
MINSLKVNNKKMKKLRIVLLVIAISFSVPLLSGCILLPAKETAVSNAPELVQPVDVTYDAAIEIAKKGSLIINFVDTAYLKPVDFYDTFFKQSGLKLKEIYVKEGDTVQEGQLIAEADSSSLDSQIKQQENSLERARITLAQLKTGNSDIFSVEKAQLDIDSINLSLGKLKSDLDKTKLYSPVTGKVVYTAGTKDVKMKAGEAIAANKTMVRIADHSKLEAEFIVDLKKEDQSKFLTYIQTGMKVEMEVDSKQYEGEITFTPKDLKFITDKNDPRLNLVRMKIINMPSDITAGTPANFTYTYDRKDNVIILPRYIINTYGSLNYVVTLEDNKPVEKYVILGLTGNTQVEVKSGLNEGDKIISKRYQ